MINAKDLLFDEENVPRHQGLIFDFDGTLADSMDVWDWVDIEFLRRRNLPLTKEYTAQLSTMGFVTAADYVIDLYGLQESPEAIMEEWNELAFERYSQTVQFKAGALDFVTFMRGLGVKTSIATTLSPVLLEAVLANTDAAQYFDTYATGYDVEHDKSEPDIYLLAAQRMEVDPRNCCVFEDIEPGIKSAKRAGMGAIAVYSGHATQNEDVLKQKADSYIKAFAELL